MNAKNSALLSLSVTVSMLLAACGGVESDSTIAEGGPKRTFGADARAVPAQFQVRQALGSSGRGVVFLNFAGGRIRYGGSSSKQNTSWMLPEGTTSTIPAFDASHLGSITTAAATTKVLDWVRADYRAYDVTFVTTRPTSGDYTMVMVGGAPSAIGESDETMGIAPLDEGNPNRNDVVFVFSEAISTLKEVSNCISHEVGHSFGLQHLEPETAMMHPYLMGGTLKFLNAAMTDEAGTQDQPRVLAGLFGAPIATSPTTQPSTTVNSAFVSQELPSTLMPGETFIAKVTFKNTGTTTWSSAGAFALMAADSTWGGTRLPNTTSVAPGATRTFSFYAKAPATAGTYKFQWFVTKDGQKVGAVSTAASIVVKAAANRIPVGRLELADGERGLGWAFDADVPGTSIAVDIYIDDQYAGTVTANLPRTDLGDEGVVGQAHGFEFGMPPLGAGVHTIEVYAHDNTGDSAYKLNGDFYVTP